MTPEIIIILHNIRSVYNVGAILRTAEGLGISEAIFSGYTPRYEDASLLPHLREKLNHQIAKSALGAEKLVPQRHIDDLPAYLSTLRQAGWLIAGLENNLAPGELPRRRILGRDRIFSAQTAEKSPKPSRVPSEPLTVSSKTPLTSPTSATPAHLALLLGEEVHGIPPALRSELDFFLEIPMSGQKESFNVSVATAIALWALQNCG